VNESAGYTAAAFPETEQPLCFYLGKREAAQRGMRNSKLEDIEREESLVR